MAKEFLTGINIDGILSVTESATVTTSVTTPLIYGSTAAGGDITIEGTSSATKTNSYVNLQTTGGNVGIGTANPNHLLDIAGTTAKAWLGVSSTTLIDANPNGRLVIGRSDAVGSGVLDLVSNAGVSTIANIGLFQFGNYGIAGADKRIGIIEGQLDGAINSGKLNFYTMNAGALAVKMNILANGNVGIQAITPLSKLGINGNLSVGANYSGIVATTNGAIIEGNVGIGNTTPTFLGAGNEITVGSRVGTTVGVLNLISNTTVATDGALGYVNFGNANVPIRNVIFEALTDGATNSGKLAIYTSNAGSLGARMMLRANGNVGIGLTAPASLLHSAGQIRTGIPLGGLGGATAADGSLLFYNATNTNTINITSGVTSTTYSLTLPLAQGAASTVLTNNGAGVLSWAAAGAGSGWAITGNTGTTASTSAIGVAVNNNFIGTTDAKDFVVASNNLERIRITSGGNVGIGTASPLHKLGVTSSNAGVAGFSTSQTGNVSNIAFLGGSSWGYGIVGTVSGTGVSGGDVYGLGYIDNPNVSFTNVLNWTSTGRVGIGTVAPLSKLGITGNLSVGATYGAIAAPTSGAIIEGNVGIGTSSVSNKFTVQSSTVADGVSLSFFVNSTSALTNSFGINSTVSGTNTTNTAAFFSATGATNNYGLIVADGRVGVGTTTPTAVLHLKAGTATANTGSFKIDEAPNLLITIEKGAFEFFGGATHFGTATGVRKTFAFLESPLFTGVPSAPTASALTNTTQLATTAFVTTANLTNANLTGHITSVGNAAVLGSFTSANLSTALTDETGTGVAVFNNSPVFNTSIQVATNGYVQADVSGGPAYILNGSTVFGHIQQSSGDKWSLGHGVNQTINSDSVLTWTKTNLVGINTLSPNSMLDIKGSLGLAYDLITAATTLTHVHHYINITNAGATFAITLPSASTCLGRVYKIKQMTGASCTVTGGANSIVTVNNTTVTSVTLVISQLKWEEYVSNGTVWISINN